jgi:hypothetical protein
MANIPPNRRPLPERTSRRGWSRNAAIRETPAARLRTQSSRMAPASIANSHRGLRRPAAALRARPDCDAVAIVRSANTLGGLTTAPACGGQTIHTQALHRPDNRSMHLLQPSGLILATCPMNLPRPGADRTSDVDCHGETLWLAGPVSVSSFLGSDACPRAT